MERNGEYVAPFIGGVSRVTVIGTLIHSLRHGDPVEEVFPGNSRLQAVGVQPAADVSDRFVGLFSIGDPAGARGYRSVHLGQPWPGISLRLHAGAGGVERVFEVMPGADPADIRVELRGVYGVAVGADGRLLMRADGAALAMTAPVAYQDNPQGRRPVDVAYWTDGRSYGFRPGAYDRDRPLVIDPLLQATYLGGPLNEGSASVALHPDGGDVYVATTSDSWPFPPTALATGGGNGGRAAFVVARLSPDLKTVHRLATVGCSAQAGAPSIAIHPESGDVFVAGSIGGCTDFPGLAESAQPRPGGATDVVLFRMSRNLDTVYRASFLGGSGSEAPTALAFGADGDLYVAGHTSSRDLPFAAGAAQPANAGGYDLFVARVEPSLSRVVRASYFGGGGSELMARLATAGDGGVYLAGQTQSSHLAAAVGGAQSVHGGGLKDFVLARFTADLASLTQASFLGGPGEENSAALTLAPDGNLLLVGTTDSARFPGLPGGADAGGFGTDFVLARIAPDLRSLLGARRLGGDAAELAPRAAFHPRNGDIYLAGGTYSGEFPGAAIGSQNTSASTATPDLVLARLSADLKQLRQSTYYGGSASDQGPSLAIDPRSGDVVVAALTGSTDLWGTQDGAGPDAKHGSAYRDNLVLRFSDDLRGPDSRPDGFRFADKSDVPPDTLVMSNTVTIKGINVPVPIGISGGEYALNGSRRWTAAPGSIESGDTVTVRHKASPDNGASRETVVRIGGRAAKFVSRTADATPVAEEKKEEEAPKKDACEDVAPKAGA